MNRAFDQFSARCRDRIDAALDARLSEPDPQRPELAQAIRYSLFNGGKRVRPILVYAVGEALGVSSNTGLDAVAGALECIHAYSLAHDDLPAMDDDDLRRGQPSCHVAFDEATAILAGDALQALAFQWLAETPNLNPGDKPALIGHLARSAGMEGMVLGQAIDLGAVNQPLDLQQLERMHRFKTGALIRASVIMSAIASHASEAQQQALESYASALGLAFQVQDDILDVTADTATLGKHQGADRKKNKPTYVSLLGLEGAREKARTLSEQALAAVEGFDARADILRHMANYIIQRGN